MGFIFFQSFYLLAQPVFDSDPVEEATYGIEYLYEIETSGTFFPPIIEQTGILPQGVSFNSFLDVLSGAPLETGSFDIVLEAYSALNPGNKAFQEFTLTVAPAELTVTADPQTITYGETIPELTFTYSGFVNGDDPSDLDVIPTASTTANSTSSTGVYPITITGGSDENYTFNYVGANLTINKAPQSITFDAPANKTYGDPAFDLSAGSSSGLPISFSVISGSASISGNTLTILGAGDITVEARQSGNENYEAAEPVTRTFTVGKASLIATAEDKSTTYGSPIPSFTIAYSGFANSETAAVLDIQPTISSSANSSSNAGSYPITLSGGIDNNYEINLVNGTLVVNKAILTVTPDNKTITFGNTIPPLTLSYSGFVNNQNASVLGTAPTASTTATSSSPAGSYLITVSGGVDENYSFNYVNGSLTINKVNQTITFDPINNKTYGDPAFSLTATANSGLPVTFSIVSGNATLSGNTLTITGSGNITVRANQPGNENYNAAPSVDQTFTVNKAVLNVAADNKIITYGSAIPALTFSYSGFVNGDTFVGIDVAPNISTSANSASNVGTYPITLSGGTDNNYSFNFVNGMLTINKATASVTISNLLQNFNGSPRPVTINTIPAGLPVSVTYNGSTQVPSAAGTYNVEAIITSNNYIGSNSAVLTINSAPQSSGIPDFNKNEDAPPFQINLLNYISDAEDNNNQLTFELVSNTNSALFNTFTLTNATLNVSLKPNANGNTSITIKCTDSNGLFITESFDIIVAPVQDAPTFTSTPVTEVNQGELYIYEIIANDADQGDQLTITSNISLPPWLSLTATGNGRATLRGTPGNNNTGLVGISLRVQDNNNNSANQFFDINVIDVNDPPTFTSSPNTSATLNAQYTYNITTNDIDENDQLTLSVISKPVWLNFTNQGNGRGRLQGAPGNDSRGQPQNVELRVQDNRGASATQSYAIEIDFPNSAPQFTSTPVTSATEDQQYSYTITVNDADDDDINLNGIVIPGWLTLTPTPTGGRLRGTPTNSDVGNHTIVLEAEDFLGLTSTQSFTITVQNVNDAPVITSEPPLAAIQNSLYTYTITTLDVDKNDEVTISIVEKPEWLNFDGEATLSGTPTANEVNEGPFTVEILAKDLAGASDKQRYQITVRNENLPPTIDPIPDPATVNEDAMEQITIPLTGISAGGESNQTISISVSTNFPGLFENLNVHYSSPNTTGELTYQIRPDSFGIATVTVRLEDSGPADINFYEETFQVEVLPVNDAPVFTSQPKEKIQPETTYTYQITGRDADPDDELTIEMLVGPEWLTLTDDGDGSALLQGNVPLSADNEEIILRITDSQGLFSEQEYQLQINIKPSIQNFSISMKEDIPYSINISEFQNAYTDPNGDPLEAITISWTRGSIQNNGQNISSGEEIAINSSTSIQYIPPTNFFGDVTLQWAAYDGFNYSETANILVKIDSVNDKPTLSNIETGIIEYIQGSGTINLTETITVSDVDDQIIDSAFIEIVDNYNPEEDRINISNQNNPSFSSSFDVSTGIFVLAGEATKSAYETALREITYENINALTNDTRLKSISMSVSDGSALSEPVFRQIQITNILPELDIVNAFTPDGNGVNDTWDFVNLDQFEQVNIAIYNSSGLEVFSCNTTDCEWNGTYKGEELAGGVYFYLINLNNGRRKYEGSVTILK
ncbi:hypothetical protein GCM10011506_29140 [Marivirga lumbricoides]|uniref:Cadherin domain-containing protein n=2 Tax=Marivirga lumbricoides TaxID=1046115 RepID=A0ABQ1MK70_9BACT|nr:hypothetical protein GCM10011506_29140 [Marivirga lumbricoides]